MVNFNKSEMPFTPEEARKYWQIAYWTKGFNGEEIKIMEYCEETNEIEVLRIHKDYFDGDWNNLTNPGIDDIMPPSSPKNRVIISPIIR